DIGDLKRKNPYFYSLYRLVKPGISAYNERCKTSPTNRRLQCCSQRIYKRTTVSYMYSKAFPSESAKVNVWRLPGLPARAKVPCCIFWVVWKSRMQEQSGSKKRSYST